MSVYIYPNKRYKEPDFSVTYENLSRPGDNLVDDVNIHLFDNNETTVICLSTWDAQKLYMDLEKIFKPTELTNNNA